MRESLPHSGAATCGTLVELFERRVAQSAADQAVVARRGGRFVDTTWQQLAWDVRRTAAALAGIGVQPGDHVVQVAENRYEWLVFDFAIQMARAVHVPVHATLSDQQIAFQIANCDARVIAVATGEQLERLSLQTDQLPQDAIWILYDEPTSATTASHVLRWSELVGDISEEQATLVQQQSRRLVPADLATILYTSGTTGNPKGVMLTHGNLVSNALGVLEEMDLDPDDLRLSMLPWSHIFARTCDIYTWIVVGCRLAIAESREAILDNCKELRPTLLNAVPYFFEKLHDGLRAKGADQASGSLKALLGGRMRLCCSGGAALPRHVEELFQRQNILLLQGYGLTETSPAIAICTPKAHRIGTVGRPISGVDVDIADDGEILTRGPHLMAGYYKDQVATDAVIRDGWFHTGDLGSLDADGYLTITGRKKEMIVLSTGKNVAPVNIEQLLTAEPLIQQAMVLGDGRSHLTALIVPAPDVLRSEIMRQAIPVTSPQDALRHQDVQRLYRDAIDRQLGSLAHHEQISTFHLLDRGFTVESGELTPTLKLRRTVILENCAEAVAAMYAG